MIHVGTIILTLEIIKEFILCLKLLMFFADFSSDGRLFHILGPRYERHFCPVLLFRNGCFNFFSHLRVIRL